MTDLPNVSDFILNYTRKLCEKAIEEAMSDWEDAEDLFYIAEEIEDPIIGKSNIAQYWRETGAVLQKLGIRVGDITTRVIAENVTGAIFPMHWNGMMAGPNGDCLGGDVKVVTLVKHVGDQLKFCQWTESSLGPLPFLRKIYAQRVDPGFNK